MNTKIARLAALCPTSFFRAERTLDLSHREIDALIASSAGRVRIDHLGMIVTDMADYGEVEETERAARKLSDAEHLAAGRCLWTVHNEDRA